MSTDSLPEIVINHTRRSIKYFVPFPVDSHGFCEKAYYVEKYDDNPAYIVCDWIINSSTGKCEKRWMLVYEANVFPTTWKRLELAKNVWLRSRFS